MSEESQIKEEIGWYKVIFAIFIATDLSLLAWFVQNFEQTSFFILLLCSAAVVAITLILVLINKRVFVCLDRLKEL
ncbi:MAG: hypothetical protein PSN35_03690 [Candidatus Thioglobus sp.]|uniref:hypothetical protein n=1 Tax=Candidatus Thioglobus sp. TaxID=2026721 RepID=UPI0026103A3B|nr:hypothetical protein [Candidatus Thioglobus sp.]MDC9726921.1 hypothetical protein [Candidatus Thioglobus sp.]